MQLNFQMVGQQAHHGGRFYPGNFFQLFFSLGERDKEDIAADIATYDFHHLAVRDVLGAGDFDVLPRVNAEAPRARAVEICGCQGRTERGSEQQSDGNLLQPVGGFFRKSSAAYRDALLGTQERRFFIVIEIDDAAVEFTINVFFFPRRHCRAPGAALALGNIELVVSRHSHFNYSFFWSKCRKEFSTGA